MKLVLSVFVLFSSAFAQAADINDYPEVIKPSDDFQTQCWDASQFWIEKMTLSDLGTRFLKVNRLVSLPNTYYVTVLEIPEHGSKLSKVEYAISYADTNTCELQDIAVNSRTVIE